MLSRLSLEDEQHGNASEDEDEVTHGNEVENKLTKITETYCSIARLGIGY